MRPTTTILGRASFHRVSPSLCSSSHRILLPEFRSTHDWLRERSTAISYEIEIAAFPDVCIIEAEPEFPGITGSQTVTAALGTRAGVKS